jgi:hypothetical protein
MKPLRAPLLIGDAKLTDIKKALNQLGLDAEFEKGALVVGADRSIRVLKVHSFCRVFCDAV